MANKKQIFFFMLALFSTTEALILGRCPFIRPKTDLNIIGLFGRWYEHSTYSFNGLQKCTFFDFNHLQTNGIISFAITSTGRLTGLQTGSTGEAVVSGPGTLRLTKDGIAGILGNQEVAVLDTDYSNYVVFYGCEELLGLGIAHNRYAWILTRARQPISTYIQRAQQALRNNGLSVKDLKLTSQLQCPMNRDAE